MFFPYISYIWGNMSLSVVSITLNIRNNRTYPQRINVLGSPVNPLDTANALTEYRWDITAFTPSSSDTLTLEYKPLGASVFSTYTYLLSNPNSEALVAALNGLGIGYFNYYTELGQNYLSTNNDDYVFGNLTINSNVPVTPTTSTTYNYKYHKYNDYGCTYNYKYHKYNDYGCTYNNQYHKYNDYGCTDNYDKYNYDNNYFVGIYLCFGC